MVYVLSAVGVLLVITLVGLIILVVASRMHDNLEDIDDGECDDDPEPDRYVHNEPPFAILRLGPSGQHDRYPISDGLRRMWTAHLDASWNLPEREPGATR